MTEELPATDLRQRRSFRLGDAVDTKKSKSAAIRLLVAESNAIVREGLATILGNQSDMQLIGKAADEAAAVEVLAETACDLTLLGPGLGASEGLAAVATIRRRFAAVRVLIIGKDERYGEPERAVEAGADGWIAAASETQDLVRAVRSVAMGGRWIASGADHGVGPRIDEVERDILRRVASGRSTREIAVDLQLSERNLRASFERLFAKLGAKNRTEAVLTALRRGVIELEDEPKPES